VDQRRSWCIPMSMITRCVPTAYKFGVMLGRWEMSCEETDVSMWIPALDGSSEGGMCVWLPKEGDGLVLSSSPTQYAYSLLLPESDPYHPWEKRFLEDPGTMSRYCRAAVRFRLLSIPLPCGC
jgi:hypothetical protein